MAYPALGDTTPLHIADASPDLALAVRYHSPDRQLDIVYRASPRRRATGPALLIGAALAFAAGGLSVPLGFVVLLCIVLLGMLLGRGEVR